MKNGAIVITRMAVTIIPIKLIKKNINDYLNSLGANKKWAEDTFYIMLILFLIDIKLFNFDQYLPSIKEMFALLPLFEEEKILIDIEV